MEEKPKTKSKGGHKRKAAKYPGVMPEMHPRSRWEYIDLDYVKKLSDSDKAYMSKFMDEYYGATLAPVADPEQWNKDFHNTKETRKQCQDRNNARNRDLFTANRTAGYNSSLHDRFGRVVSSVEQLDLNPLDHENILHELIDGHGPLRKFTLVVKEWDSNCDDLCESSGNGHDNAESLKKL